MKNICCLILSLVLINLGGCAVNPATGEQDLVLMSEQSEIALGRKTGKEVLQHLNGLYPQGKANSKPLLKIVNQSDQDLSISVKNSVS